MMKNELYLLGSDADDLFKTEAGYTAVALAFMKMNT